MSKTIQTLLLLCLYALLTTTRAQSQEDIPIEFTLTSEEEESQFGGPEAEVEVELSPDVEFPLGPLSEEEVLLPVESADNEVVEFTLVSEEEIVIGESGSDDGDVTYTALSEDAYACPSGYHYVSYSDYVNNVDALCSKLGDWSITRIQGGGSVDGSGYDCRTRQNDPRETAQSLCVKTSIVNVRLVNDNTCPFGYDVMSIREATDNSRQICSNIGEQTVARVGVRSLIRR